MHPWAHFFRPARQAAESGGQVLALIERYPDKAFRMPPPETLR